LSIRTVIEEDGAEKPYPSDISRRQFEPIRPLLESVRKRTKPRTVDLHEVFNAVLYLLKSGCQWRLLPQGFPNRSTVYSYFAKWSKPGPDGVSALERALKNRLARPARNWGATRRPVF
jgi:transposase